MSALSLWPRSRQPEWMDDPDLCPDLHRHALLGLERINRWSGAARGYVGPCRRLMQEAGDSARPIRLLDAACGGGDVLAQLRPKLTGSHPIEFHGCDLSPTAVRQTMDAGGAGHAYVHDLLQHDLPQQYEIILCGLFLHHFDRDDVVTLLQRFAKSTSLLIISDLVRSRRAYASTAVATRLLTRSPVVHVDALRSVRAAWTPSEMRDLFHEAGLHGVDVRRVFPMRMRAVWRRPSGESDRGRA